MVPQAADFLIAGCVYCFQCAIACSSRLQGLSLRPAPAERPRAGLSLVPRASWHDSTVFLRSVVIHKVSCPIRYNHLIIHAKLDHDDHGSMDWWYAMAVTNRDIAISGYVIRRWGCASDDVRLVFLRKRAGRGTYKV